MFVTIIFHSPDMPRVSPAVMVTWDRPLADFLPILSPPYPRADLPEPAAAELIGACLQHPDIGVGRVEVANVPGLPDPHGDNSDDFVWYRALMAQLRTWQPPPVLVNMDPPYEIEQAGAVLGRWLPLST